MVPVVPSSLEWVCYIVGKQDIFVQGIKNTSDNDVLVVIYNFLCDHMLLEPTELGLIVCAL